MLLLVLISDLRDRIEVVVGGASNALCIGIQLAMCQFQNQQFALSLYGHICRTYGSIHCVQGPSMVLIIDLQSYYNHPKHFCHNPRVIYTDKDIASILSEIYMELLPLWRTGRLIQLGLGFHIFYKYFEGWTTIDS